MKRNRRLNNQFAHADDTALTLLAQGGDHRAVEALLARHEPLARRLANKYLPTFATQEFDDLLQAARIGLLKAIRTFDATRGVRFSTHATWWIRGEISRLRRTDAIIRIPQHVTEGKHVPEYLPHCTYSLDEILPANAIGQGTDRYIDLIVAPCNLEDDICNTLDDATRAAINALPDRLRHALIRRYGLDGHAEHTLEEIGAQLGVTKESARQYIQRALTRLRNTLAVEDLP